VIVSLTPAGANRTIALCFAAALMEGCGLQTIGISTHRLALDLHLTAVQLGWLASTSTVGLLPGAILGGAGQIASGASAYWLSRSLYSAS